MGLINATLIFQFSVRSNKHGLQCESKEEVSDFDENN